MDFHWESIGSRLFPFLTMRALGSLVARFILELSLGQSSLRRAPRNPFLTLDAFATLLRDPKGFHEGSTVFLRNNFRSRWLCQIFVLGLFYFRAGKLVHKSPAPFRFLLISFHFPASSFDVPFISFPGRGPNTKSKKMASRKCADFLINLFMKTWLEEPS